MLTNPLSRRAAVALAGAALLLTSACGLLRREPVATRERTDTYAGVSALVVHHETGSVTIGTGDTVRVSRTIRQTSGKSPSEKIVKNGGTLEVGAVCPSSFGPDTCAVDYRITAPANVTVTVRAGANPVTVRGFTAPVEVTTDSGGIQLDGIGAAVRATTKAGRIAIGPGSGPVRAKSDSGPVTIRLGPDPEPVTASAASGDIRVVAPGGPYHVTARARSGRTDVTVDQARSGPPIDVRTDSGDITVLPGTDPRPRDSNRHR